MRRTKELFINTHIIQKKPNCPQCDLYDVTLGNPAFFQNQDTLKEAQRGILRSVAFRLPITGDLAFFIKGFELPTGKRCLLGARHIHFNEFFHGITSWIEVEWLVGIPTKEYLSIDVRTKAAFCQEKSAFGKVKVSLLSGNSPESRVRA
jgi:hypothetical protein